MTFKAEIQASAGWNWSEGAVDNDRLEYAGQLVDGNAAGQAEAVWHAAGLAIAEATPLVLDLTALERVVLGSTHTLALAGVKAMLLVNSAESAGTLLVGGAESNAWFAPFAAAGDCVSVAPGGAVLLVNRQAGWPVAASAKNLKLAASGGAVACAVAIVGTVTPES